MKESMTQTILAVLAHPDDESFGMGGTLALYAERGVAVHLLCATRGEAGEVPERLLSRYGSVAELREAELACAARALGLASVRFLGYRDSGMAGSPTNRHPEALAAQPLAEVAARVAHAIRELRPQVVLTFDPIGGYRHPDHIAIHRATVEAFRLAGDPDLADGLPPYQPLKLYFHVMPKGSLRFALRVLALLGQNPHHLGRNRDIDLAALVEEGDFPTHAVIDYRRAAKRKDAAAACHASQLDGAALRRGPLRWVLRWFGARDRFMRAYPPAGPDTHEDDLFAAID